MVLIQTDQVDLEQKLAIQILNNVSNDDQMFNVFISTCINSEECENKVLFQIDGIKSKTNNKTFDANLEFKNLTQNGAADGGQTQNGFGIFNNRGEKYAKKFRLRTSRKLADQNICFNDNDSLKKKRKTKSTPKTPYSQLKREIF